MNRKLRVTVTCTVDFDVAEEVVLKSAMEQIHKHLRADFSLGADEMPLSFVTDETIDEIEIEVA